MTEVLARTPFWFLRHGETDWNQRRLTQGAVEVPLNATGLAQAKAAGEKLRNCGIASIVASPVGRAQETARIVGRALGMGFTMDEGLREARFGDQEGQVMGNWYDDWVEHRYTPENGESFAALEKRIISAMNRTLLRPAPVLVVAHGGMFRAVRAGMGLSAKVRTENGALLHCRPGEPAWDVREV